MASHTVPNDGVDQGPLDPQQAIDALLLNHGQAADPDMASGISIIARSFVANHAGFTRVADSGPWLVYKTTQNVLISSRLVADHALPGAPEGAVGSVTLRDAVGERFRVRLVPRGAYEVWTQGPASRGSL